MFTSIRRLLTAGLAMFLLLSGLDIAYGGLSQPKPVFAEESITYDHVTLWVWPEFDDPRLLVMWEGKVVKTAGTATTVKFLVPTDAEMYFTGYEDNSGNSTPVNPKRVSSDIKGYDTLSFDMPGDTFRVEYYQDSIQGNPDKTINFEFRTLYPIKNMAIDVQQPRLATNYKIEPPLQTSVKNQNLTSFESTYDVLNPDKPLSLNIKYTKTDPATSVTPGSATSGNSGSSTQGSNTIQILGPSINNTWIIIAAVAGLGGIIFFWLEKRRRDALAWEDDDYYEGNDYYEDDDYEDDYYEDERPRRRRMVREPSTPPARLRAGRYGSTLTLEKQRPQRRKSSAPRICPYCQAKVKSESSRCLACGAELED